MLIVGLGTMGISHARAYRRRSAASNSWASAPATRRARSDLDKEFPGLPRYEGLTEALQARSSPTAVAIAAYTEHHAPMALEALQAGAHVFCEKRLAEIDPEPPSASSPRRARRTGPCWSVASSASIPRGQRFVEEIGRTLGKPLVMRMNLNQQSSRLVLASA